MPALIATLLFFALQSPPADLSGETNRQLLQKILDTKNSTSHAVLEELGSRKTKPSLQALKSGLAELTGNPALKSACNAFRHYKGAPELERMAIATLYSTALEAHVTRQRMAAAGLSHFPKAGEAELLRIVNSADDPVTRANALDGILPALAKRAKKADLKTALDAMRVTLTLKKGECIKALKAFLANGDDKLFKGALEDDRHSLPVRRMILEAMENSPQGGVGEHLLSGLKSKNSSIIHGALLALANRGWTDYGKHLEKLTKSKDETIRRDALVIRAELYGSDPTFIDKLIDQAEDADRIKRSAAAISLAAVRTTDTLKALHQLLSDKEASVRFQAMEAAYSARHPSSVHALIKRLEHERGTMKPILVDRLSLLTGENFGGSQQMWSNWWRDNAEGYQCVPLKDALASKAARADRKAKDTTSASFFGLRILSDRLCFVIDNSGSMNSKTKSGKTRLEAMQDQLCVTIKDLPDGCLVNMVFFAVDAIPWKKELQTLNSKARAEAVEAIRKLKMKQATATYEGIIEGLTDPRVDTLYVLTDGQPYGGAMPNTGDILREVHRINQVRHVVIHCISVGRDSTFLAKLAEENHGQYTRVD
jgi:hypothetical protein